MRDLGILVTPKLNWNHHIKNKCQLAFSKFFGLFKAFKTQNPNLLSKLYTIYVRPIIETSSNVFNTNIQKNIKAIENIQKKITKMIFYRCFKRTYPIPPKYHIRNAILNLTSLERRMIISDLILFHKIINGKIKFSARNMPTVKPKSTINLRKPHIGFCNRFGNSIIRNNSFIIRVSHLYSKLPDHMTSLSTAMFKKEITNLDFNIFD